jgi:hypothetical protein
LEKREALFTKHEILVALDKPSIGKSIIVTPHPKFSQSPEDHVIKIETELDENSLKTITPILEKRKLKLEKTENMIIIH